jgi:AcrR family transcriptional regulator
VPKTPAKLDAYHHGDLKAALLREALKALRHQPAHELSLRDLAERLGVSKAAPYRHFPSRPEFVAAVREAGFAEFLEVLHAVEAAGAPPRESLRDLGAAYLEFACARPWLYRLLFSAEGHKLPQVPGAKAGAESFSVLLRVATRAHQAGWRAGEKPQDLAAGLWAFVHGLSLLRIEGMLQPPKREEKSEGKGEGKSDAQAWWRRLAGMMVGV